MWSTSADCQYRPTFLFPFAVPRPTPLPFHPHTLPRETFIAFNWQLMILAVAIHHRITFSTDIQVDLVSGSHCRVLSRSSLLALYVDASLRSTTSTSNTRLPISDLTTHTPFQPSLTCSVTHYPPLPRRLQSSSIFFFQNILQNVLTDLSLHKSSSRSIHQNGEHQGICYLE